MMSHIRYVRFILPALLLATLVVTGCQQASSEAPAEEAQFGAPLSEAEVITADAAIDRAVELDGSTITVEGTIREVCQNAGCWFIFETSSASVLRVHVPRDEEGEYAFTLPKDVSGRTAVVEGRLFEKELSESEQAHYTEEGAEAAPSREYRIEAQGVVVRA